MSIRVRGLVTILGSGAVAGVLYLFLSFVLGHSAGSVRVPLVSATTIRVGGETCGKDLDGDVAPEARVTRLEHFAHSARAERGEDFVRAEASAWGDRHAGP